MGEGLGAAKASRACVGLYKLGRVPLFAPRTVGGSMAAGPAGDGDGDANRVLVGSVIRF